MEPDTAQLLATYDVFDIDHFDGLDGQMLVVYAGGKPRLAYRRTKRDRWSPEIIPNTPENTQSP